jgi:hypothetical protein
MGRGWDRDVLETMDNMRVWRHEGGESRGGCGVVIRVDLWEEEGGKHRLRTRELMEKNVCTGKERKRLKGS